MVYPIFYLKDWEDRYLTRQPIVRVPEPENAGPHKSQRQFSQVILAPKFEDGMEHQLWKFEVNDLDSIVPYWALSSQLVLTYYEIYHGGWLYMTSSPPQQTLKICFRKNQLCLKNNTMVFESRYDNGTSRDGVLLMPSKDLDEQKWSLEYVDDITQRLSAQ